MASSRISLSEALQEWEKGSVHVHAKKVILYEVEGWEVKQTALVIRL